MTEPRHTVLITLVGVCHDWIGAAFEDRDNLDYFTFTGTVVAPAGVPVLLAALEPQD